VRPITEGTEGSVASPAYEQILDIQALDLRLTQLRHRLTTHPARDEVRAADNELERLQGTVAEVEARHHELERQLKRLSDEVETIEAKRRDVDAKLYDGSVTASKDLLALQDEAASLLELQRRVEDDELEVMEAMEEVSGELSAERGSLGEAEGARATAVAALAEATADLESEIEQVTGERQAAAEPANPTLLARYEELVAQFDGMPMARFVDGRCDGCHIQLSAVAVDQLAKLPEDAVVTCEECGRLLVP
jgi:predicted  nucleic acid-binding Zn-ribbon protein